MQYKQERAIIKAKMLIVLQSHTVDNDNLMIFPLVSHLTFQFSFCFFFFIFSLSLYLSPFDTQQQFFVIVNISEIKERVKDRVRERKREIYVNEREHIH
jgi:hypothetical protein